MSPESHQLLNFLARECQSATLDGDKANADKFWELLDKPLRNALQKMFLRNRDPEDLVQEAIKAIYKNIWLFDPEKASFQTWAKCQAYSAMTDYLRTTGGYSRTMAEHKKLIIKKLHLHFEAGPAVGQSLLDWAREHQEVLVSLTGLSARQVSNALDRWSLEDAADIEEVEEKAFNVLPSRFSREDVEVAMSRLEPRSRTFLIQKYVACLSYVEIAEKYNLTKAASEKPMNEVYARRIVSNACRDLRYILERMEQNGL
jgi:RNA polymerase sigma factor (sigma-70 family)